ncbi:hypothetical protein CF165_15240 [Amycolatopsis vastitatis]|uniref:Uncharacterized protein n=2 Tax=Amycolatopsis vastitatis TaxID=1905142 RepID=A0A229T9C7_9PSEU|nr:hypothetical protein CF165_15240 [Amycolatopsis vastitatis]
MYLGTDERIQYLIPGMSLSINKMVAHPSLGPVLTVSGLKLEIDEEVPAVRAANLEISGDALPEDPYPG